jgi:hypothetical protein
VDLSDGVQALRYDGLAPAGATGAVFTVPTSEGVALLACDAPAETCTTIAGSLKVENGEALPVGPSDAYAKDLESALSRLESRERAAAGDLKRAGRRATQASATAALATAYTSAGGSLAKLDVGPADAGVNRQLSDALKSAGAAYQKAAAEGRAKDRAGYARQGSRALSFRTEARQALADMESAGYTLPAKLSSGAAAFTRLPTLKKDPAAKKSSSSSSPSNPSNPSSSGSEPTPRATAAPSVPTPRATAAPTARPNPTAKPDTGGSDGGGGGGEG